MDTETIIQNLIKFMSDDNGIEFRPSPENMAKLQQVVGEAIEKGWSPTLEQLDVIAAGEVTEAETLLSSVFNGEAISDILNDVFENDDFDA